MLWFKASKQLNLFGNCFRLWDTNTMQNFFARRSYVKHGARMVAAIGASLMIAACQPLYSTGNTAGSTATGYEPLPGGNITVSPVSTRVGQQVRNRLLYVLQGGVKPSSPRFQVDLRIHTIETTMAPITSGRTNSAGNVTVVSSYEIFDLQNNHRSIARGKRQARASYDRTGQSYANLRALRDAENRAAREVAENLRLAIYADINNPPRQH